jgi:hypothetical protein
VGSQVTGQPASPSAAARAIRPRLLLAVLFCAGGCVGARAAFAQEPESARVRGEPADAAEVRAQIAAVEKRLPDLSDRAAGLYYLAAAKQHLGETGEAMRLLRECVSFREGFDPSGSPSLGMLKGTKEFDDLVSAVHRDFPAAAHAKLAFVTKEKDLIPEGLAYDARRNVFYVSSLHRRKILRLASDGTWSDFIPPKGEHLLPVLGIRVDPNDGTVWANSWDENGDRSELLHFDAAGILLGRYSPGDSARHGFNDLVVRRSGEVLLTDSVNNKVFTFDPRAHAFKPLPVHRELSAPNGIALADDDRQLYVADDFGVVRVDLESGDGRDVNAGLRSTLAGIDGLYWHDGQLVAVQNAIGSPRIAAFRLSSDGTAVTQTTVLENRSGFTLQPTTGAFRGNDFYFIANSQIDNLNGEHILDVTRLEFVRIGVLRLP